MQRAVFDGDKLTVDMPGGKTGEGVFTLKTSDNPKQIWIQIKDRSDGIQSSQRQLKRINTERAPHGELATHTLNKKAAANSNGAA